MTTLEQIAAKYNVEIEGWKEDGKVSPVPVTVLESSDENFVGWYTTGPFVAVITVRGGEVIHTITEF